MFRLLFCLFLFSSTYLAHSQVPAHIVYAQESDSIFIYGSLSDMNNLLTKTLQKRNEYVESQLLIAEIYRDMGHYHLAKDVLKDLFHDVENINDIDTRRFFQCCIRINHCRMLAESFASLNEIKKYNLDQITKDIHVLTTKGMIDRNLLFDFYRMRAKIILSYQLFDLAEETFELWGKLISTKFGKQTRQHSEYLSLLGKYYGMLGLHDKATSYYEESLSIYRDLPNCKKDVTFIERLLEPVEYFTISGNIERSRDYLDEVQTMIINCQRIPALSYVKYLNVKCTQKIMEKDFKEAEKLAKRAKENSLLSDTGYHYISLHNLAICHINLLNIQECCNECYKVLQGIKENKFYSPNVLKNTMEILSSVDLAIGQYDIVINTKSRYEDFASQYPFAKHEPYYKILSRAYIAKKMAKEASSCHNKNIISLKQKTKQHFTTYPTAERTRFWELVNSYIEPELCSLPAESDSVGCSLFDTSLFTKGLLLETATTLDKALTNETDNTPETSELYQRLRTLKAMADFTNNPQKYMLKASEIERQLMKKLNVDISTMDFVDHTWIDVKKNLDKNDVVIEFICSNHSYGKCYAAEVLRKGYKQPVHIPLFAIDESDMENKVWCSELLKHIKKGDNVYFVPAGKLHAMALEHLIYHDGKPMSDHFNMIRLSSSRRLIERKDFNKTVEITKDIAIYGGLNYNLGVEDMELYAALSKERSKSGDSWGFLPGTLYEAEEIKRITGKDSKLYIGDEGVEESFKNFDGNSPKIIHIATHGFYLQGDKDMELSSEEALNRCGLVMSGANNYWGSKIKTERITDDGILTGLEITNINLSNTELVVMSACQTALGDVSSEGVFGLQRAFKLAKAQTLLMSLWEVNDEATTMLMTEFYRCLSRGNGYRSALTMAQEKVKQATFIVNGKELSGADPRFWSAFVLLD